MSVRKSAILICLLVSVSFGQEVFVRVADTGVALCCVVRMPGNHYMVYDAGNWTGDGGLAGCVSYSIHAVSCSQQGYNLLPVSRSWKLA